MSSMSEDPIHATINGNIKRGIRALVKENCIVSAVTLTYSAIDTMAYLCTPANQQDVQRKDFKAWCEKYLPFCGPGRLQVTADGLYAARCGMVHNFGISSKLFREGKARRIGYFNGKELPLVRWTPKHPETVLLSLEMLIGGVLGGIDRTLVDLFADPARRPIIEARLQNEMMVCHDREQLDQRISEEQAGH